MPPQDTNKKDSARLQQALVKAIPLSEFEQYVSSNTPYNGDVFGVGKIGYISHVDNPLLLNGIFDDVQLQVHKSAPLTPTQKDPWTWGGAGWGGFSFYKSFQAFDKYNPFYYTTSRGNTVWYKDLKPNSITGLRSRGSQGKTYGMPYAAEKGAKLGRVANKVSFVGLIIPVAHTIYVGEVNTEDTVDFIFAAVSFIPGFGWAISGIYTVSDAICVASTGEKLATHGEKKVNEINDQLFTKWIQFNQELKNKIYSMCFGFY